MYIQSPLLFHYYLTGSPYADNDTHLLVALLLCDVIGVIAEADHYRLHCDVVLLVS